MLKVGPGDIDISECEREPVHVPGSIQPFGLLVAFTLPTWSIGHVSANAPAAFGVETPEALVGAPIETILPPKIIHDMRNTFQAAMISGFAERMNAIAIGPEQVPHDVLVHASGQIAVAEFLPCAGAETIRSDPTTLVKTIIDRLGRTTSFPAFLSSAARQIRAVTGFDRVMIYKFLEDDSGEVVAEALRAGLQPFLHLRYPASDIPAQARALFRRQWLRMIPDVTYTPVPIVPTLTAKHLPLDLSLSTLRSASPIHVQYLKNMGSAATLTVSILEKDRLWGLIACHHETPRRISTATAAAVELFAQVFSTQIEAKQQRDELSHVNETRGALGKLIDSMSPERTLFENLSTSIDLLRSMIPCDGMGVWADGRFDDLGITPPADAIDEIIRFLNRRSTDRIFTTPELSRHIPDALRYVEAASGLIAIPLSSTPRDFLLLFRKEVVQTVVWGGNPNKALEPDPQGLRIGPRRSFEAWKENVRGTSERWHPNEISCAETLRVALLDVLLHRANVIDRERKIAQESQLLLVAELNHRVKNVLAVIGSLVRQSAQGSTSLESFTKDLQSRIHALSVAHDQLTQSHWKAAPLARLIEAEAMAWTEIGDRRLDLSGPPVMIEARAYQTLALVLHEMMTNAAKYGALSVKDGHLSVVWTITEEGHLTLSWTERNGPPVSPPKRRGFGSIVVEQSIPFELRGEASMEHHPSGVRAKFTIPADFVEVGEDPVARLEPRLRERADLRGKMLLLVEDSMMIALDAQNMLQNCGAEVELAATASEARRALKLNRFDAAILDVNLYTETSFAIAEDLQDRAIPFVFATGYGETINVPERFRSICIISKPYAEDVLRAALVARATT